MCLMLPAIAWLCSLSRSKLQADEPRIVTTRNQLFSEFVLPETGQQIAATSQAVTRIEFAGSKFGKLEFEKDATSAPETRIGQHASVCIFKMVYTPAINYEGPPEVFSPVVSFSIYLLPELPSMTGRKPTGRLEAVNMGCNITENGWYPAETRLGAFGATFATQKCETASSDRDFVRWHVPEADRNRRTSFSLPIDLQKHFDISRYSKSDTFTGFPISIYEDFTPDEWVIYCRLHDEGVEIWHGRARWEPSNAEVTMLVRPTSAVYRVGDLVEVSNLRFRIAGIVHFHDQAYPTAWINIYDLDVAR